MKLRNSVIVITGASSGVGFDVASTLARDEHQVIALSRSLGRLKEVVNEIDNLQHFAVDISSWIEVQRVFSEVEKEFGPIDCLINNAAKFYLGKFGNQDVSNVDDLIDTNIKGTIYCTKCALEQMRNRSSGRIINVLSVSGLQGIENQAVYSASKHALSGFMNALAQEVKDEGVAITNLYPGGIDTDLWKRLPEEYDLDVSQFMQPQDISNVVKFVLRLPNHLILKEMTFFPTNDWH